MKTVLNRAALLLGVTCFVWIGVLWQWQRTRRDMSMADIVLYLGALPLAVIVLLVVTRWAWRGVAAMRVAQAGTPASAGALEGDASGAGAGDGVAGPDAGAGPGALAGDEALRHLAWPVWMGAVCTPAGASPDEVLQAAQSQMPRPALVPQFTSRDGAAVMAARIADLEIDSLRQPLDHLDRTVRAQRQAQGLAAPAALEERVLRALAAMAAALEEVPDALQRWARSAEADDRAGGEGPWLHVLLALPHEWHEHERQVAEDWVRLRLTTDPQAPAVPVRRFMLVEDPAGGETLCLQADRILAQHAGRKEDVLVLLLAAHSDLSDAGVDALESSGRLFHAALHPKGHMPSEAAAALLLSSPLHPGSDNAARLDAAPWALLHRPAFTHRGKPVDAPGRVDAQVLSTVMAQGQAAARLQPLDIAALVGDGDQHSARGTELFGAALDCLPHLDAVEDVRQLGVVCGGAGTATPLLVLAAACAQAAALDRPVLAICQGHATARLALVVRPATAPEPAPAPAPANHGGPAAA